MSSKLSSARRSIPVLGLIASLLLALHAGLVAQERQSPSSVDSQVVVVPIEGEIGVVTVRLVQRAIDLARDAGMSRVILDIDTPGGAITVLREIESILAALQSQSQGGVRITAFVRRKAWSAGGYLALACDDTFMAPGASIGAITPVEVGPEGIRQIADDDARRKMLSAFRSDVRSLVERRGDVSESTMVIAEAMVDPTMRVFEVTYTDSGGLETTRVFDQVGLDELTRNGARVVAQHELGTTPLTLTADEALRWGLSSGTYDSISDLAREELLLPPSAVERLVPSWSESAVEWLETMKPFLFVLGFLLLLVEVKVPGLIVPGALGVLLISLGLFSSFLVGLADWTEILLFFLGLVMIGAEIFLMPGTFVFGFLGFLSLVFALVLSQQTFIIPSTDTQRDILNTNLLNLLWLILILIGGAALFYRYLPRIPFFNRALLIPPEPDRTGDSTRFASASGDLGSRADMIGVEGVAVTDLRPAGILEREDGVRMDVVSQGAFIEGGRRLRVVDVHGNRIVVVPADEAGTVDIGILFLLVIAGLAMIIAEVFFISGGLLSVGAAVALVASIFLAFTQHGQGTGFLFLAMAAIGAPASLAFAFRVLPKTSLGRKLLLSGPRPEDVHGSAEEQGLSALLGERGVTLSILRPAGYARIGDRRIDVVTRGEHVEQDTPIQVIEVEANRVVVAAVEPGASQTDHTS